MQGVPYDYYRIFYYVAKYKSFTRAADILLNSQPNITRSMNNLEQELGCRLFLRSNRGITLTPEGEKLYSHIQIAWEQILAGEYELSRVRKLESGYVSIGASEIALHQLLLPVLRRFRLTYPGLHIQITNHSTPQAVAAVKNGQVELAVISTAETAVRPLSLTRLSAFRDILIGGPSYRELAGRRLSIRELSGYPLVSLGRNTATYEFYNRLFAEHETILEPAVEAATTDQILPMVKYDLGLGFLPESFALGALERKEVLALRLAEEIPCRYICLIKDKKRPMSIAAKELEAFILEAASEKKNS